MYSKIIIVFTILVSTTFFANANESSFLDQFFCPIDIFPSRHDVRIIEAAINCGQDINKRSEISGLSALRLAIVNNQIDSIKALLKAPGIDVTSESAYGDSVLIYAMSYENLEAFRLLMNDKRIDLNLQNRAGTSALHFAVSRRLTEMVRMLASDPRVNLNLKNRYGSSALSYATSVEDLEIARAIILNSRGRLSAETINNAITHAELNDNQKLIDLLHSL